ncbi:MAG: helix-turn-helix domain-containing protein [Syntrophales bacterium]|jgi:DNA-binding IclR family transcriptional regulator|nr:helix-turn-helix domain-containing protein [Syntrophales bacterium]MCK9390292.1 helix-turn-helix domain-containing protein [Syntrophales bacterium]
MAAKSCRKIDVLLTADRILGVLQDSKDPLSVSELAKLTGLSVDIVFRQLGTMEDIRWVHRIGDGYMLGMRIAVLWARKKALTEDRINKINAELTELEGC